MAVKGLAGILANIDRQVSAAKTNRRIALTKVGLRVKADSVKNAPADTGNLRGSAYHDVRDDSVFVGFTAAYAPFVHENLEQKLKGQPRTSGTGKGRYWDSGGPKFLSRAVQSNRRWIVEQFSRRFKV